MVCSPDTCPRSGGKGWLQLEPWGAGMGFAVAAAHPGWRHTLRWWGGSHPLHQGFRGAKLWEHGAQRLWNSPWRKILQTSLFLTTLDLSECLVLILALSILKTVQGPITVCYHTEYNICKGKMKSRFELENHGHVIKTKEMGHSDVVKTFFLWFLSKSASSKTSLILWGGLVLGRAPRSGAAVPWWFLWRGSYTPCPCPQAVTWGSSVSPALTAPQWGPHLNPIFKAFK